MTIRLMISRVRSLGLEIAFVIISWIYVHLYCRLNHVTINQPQEDHIQLQSRNFRRGIHLGIAPLIEENYSSDFDDSTAAYNMDLGDVILGIAIPVSPADLFWQLMLLMSCRKCCCFLRWKLVFTTFKLKTKTSASESKNGAKFC